MKKERFPHIVFESFLVVLLLILAYANDGYTFGGCEEGCERCHSLSEGEVKIMLEKMKAADAKIMKIQMSPIKGLWEVDIDNNGRRGLFYVDFSKKYVVSGSVFEVNAAINKTKERLDEINRDRRINPSGISLKDALILGSNKATKKVIVFTDPD